MGMQTQGQTKEKHMQGEATTMATHVNMCWHEATHVHACAFLPCVSVDWVNQPNFPFFFSVRSASVTPWRYQHAVHTARQQRQQWTSTEQREGGREKEREKEEESTARESCRTHYSTNTATAPRKASKSKKNLSAKPEPGLCFPRIIQQSRIKSICKRIRNAVKTENVFFFTGIHISHFFKNLTGQKSK